MRTRKHVKNCAVYLQVLLSVIIVNYNVRDLLGKCLYSVKVALSGIPSEVFIVDNCSTDGSVAALQPLFPEFSFMQNETNAGFAKANNQALKAASGRYILFLNPDTVVPPDCFTKCIGFMESKPLSGALGVKMINGNGKYLKESKRGFPSPSVSFWKMTGIINFFPRSPYFSRYYLGQLDENKSWEIDVLSGAFFFAKKEALDKTGGFDEQFFMYAEDIDLSFRIQQQGYKNYYYPDTTIIHYKGESTKKDSKYIRQFYKAMSQFVKKHYRSGIFRTLLNGAIWIRAGIAVLRSSKKK